MTIRIGIVLVLMFVAYGIAPLDYRRDGETALRVLGTVGVIVVVTAWQLWAIHVARFPALTAIEGFAPVVPLVLLGFAATYVQMSTANPDTFTQPIDRVGAVYFSMTTMATVGFGDIAAITDGARITVMLQMAADVIVLVVVARVMVTSVKVAAGRARDERVDREADPEG